MIPGKREGFRGHRSIALTQSILLFAEVIVVASRWRPLRRLSLRRRRVVQEPLLVIVHENVALFFREHENIAFNADGSR